MSKRKNELRDNHHQLIDVGDFVVCNPPYVKGISVGVVIGCSAKQLKIHAANKIFRRSASEVFKVTEQVQIAKETNPEYFI